MAHGDGVVGLHLLLPSHVLLDLLMLGEKLIAAGLVHVQNVLDDLHVVLQLELLLLSAGNLTLGDLQRDDTDSDDEDRDEEETGDHEVDSHGLGAHIPEHTQPHGDAGVDGIFGRDVRVPFVEAILRNGPVDERGGDTFRAVAFEDIAGEILGRLFDVHVATCADLVPDEDRVLMWRLGADITNRWCVLQESGVFRDSLDDTVSNLSTLRVVDRGQLVNVLLKLVVAAS